MTTKCWLAVLFSVLCPLSSVFSQGSLTPPAGTPAPLFKTLQQVEPRTDLQATPLPPGVTTDPNYHYIISTPGSYYLSSNLGVTKPNGIHVTVAGVTVDLNGFQISRSSGSGGDGITIGMTAHGCTIKNGTVSGFAGGVFCFAFQGPPAQGGAFLQLSVSGCSTGIRTGQAWRIEGCQAYGNSGTGIAANAGSTLNNCTAYGNQGSTAISASGGCTLANCAAYNNQVTYAISAIRSTLINCSAHFNSSGSADSVAIDAQFGSTLTNCVAHNNQVTWGIRADQGSTLTNCSATSNTSAAAISGGFFVGVGSNVIGCASLNNFSTAAASITTGMGIDTGDGVTIKDCATTYNKADGIRVANSCLVTGNNSSQNGVGSPNGDGIRTTGDNNRIDGNVVNGNSQYGIRTVGTSIVVRNWATGNATANYHVSTGTNIGPIQTPNTATSPWANF